MKVSDQMNHLKIVISRCQDYNVDNQVLQYNSNDLISVICWHIFK